MAATHAATPPQELQEGMYHTKGFPAALLVAAPQPMEWWDFAGALDCTQQRVCSFEVHQDGVLEGLHLHMQASTVHVVTHARLCTIRPVGHSFTRVTAARLAWPCLDEI